MSVLSRPSTAVALVALLVVTYLPGPSLTRAAGGSAARPAPACCGAMACCRPGHDCARHGGCDGMSATGATASGASADRGAPHAACLTTPGCAANQPVPAPHVFDPMLPAVAARTIAPPAGDRARRGPELAPRGPASEPSVPPPRV
ncbi:MAG TPA: hypothetical protein VF363_06775 [Candidatus Eisenbacteria bacterium]